MEAVLKVENLRFAYSESRSVLTMINLTLSKGERIALVGPNGSGKTTLFLLLCGILKAESGLICTNGKTVLHSRFNPEISYLFQSPDDQLFSSTVFDDIAFGPLNMGLSPDEVRERAAKALESVGCIDLAQRAPHHLSGGEKRMAAIATILSMSPGIILFDEPTSALDSRNRRRVIQTILSISQSMIIASHDLEFLLETCQRVLLLDCGRIVADGPIREILADETLLKAHGLEKPHSLVPHRVAHKH